MYFKPAKKLTYRHINANKVLFESDYFYNNAFIYYLYVFIEYYVK